MLTPPVTVVWVHFWISVPQGNLLKTLKWCLQPNIVDFLPFYKKYILTTPSSYFIIGLPPPAALEFLEDDHEDEIDHVKNKGEAGGDHN